jgi:acetyl-CoA carboxylase carboxyl transferase subunit beta
MLGDFNIAEPGALIGFAGPRVVRDTIGKDLPKGFQSAEFVMEHGFLDFIVDRKDLKDKLTSLLKMIQ